LAVFWNGFTTYFAGDIVRDRVLFGSARTRRLSFVPVKNFHEMGCECKLVFGRSRGGPVEDAVIARRPDGRGRSNVMAAPAPMPILRPEGVPRPCGAYLVPFLKGELSTFLTKPHRLAVSEMPGCHVYVLMTGAGESRTTRTSKIGCIPFRIRTRANGLRWCSAKPEVADTRLRLSALSWTGRSAWRTAARHAAVTGSRNSVVDFGVQVPDDPKSKTVGKMILKSLRKSGRPYLSDYAKSRVVLKLPPTASTPVNHFPLAAVQGLQVGADAVRGNARHGGHRGP
jgi:hypothetical protein